MEAARVSGGVRVAGVAIIVGGLCGANAPLAGACPTALDEDIARQWRAALPGLRVRIVPVFFGLLPDVSQYLKQTSEIFWLEDYPDPQDWLQFFISPPSDYTPLIGALVQRTEATLDPTTRLALYHQAEMTLLNDAVVVPLAQQELERQAPRQRLSRRSGARNPAEHLGAHHADMSARRLISARFLGLAKCKSPACHRLRRYGIVRGIRLSSYHNTCLIQPYPT